MFNTEEEKKQYNIEKYKKAKDKPIICSVCNKSYNMFTKSHHMKSKHHLITEKISKLENQINNIVS